MRVIRKFAKIMILPLMLLIGILHFVLNTAITSMFRINYEQYFNNSKDMSALYKEPQYNHNKLSLEYLIYF